MSFGGEADGKPELVQEIKAWQRKSAAHKESWYNFVYSELGVTDYDPNRHNADILQTFVDRARAGEIELAEPSMKGSSKGRSKGPTTGGMGSFGMMGGGSWGNDDAAGWDAVAQMGKGKGINPMMMMSMMNQMSGMMSGMMGMGMGMRGCMGGGGGGGGGGRSSMPPNAKPGDWICPGCGDLVFARKSSCSMCGTSQSADDMGGLGGMGGCGGGGCGGCGGGGSFGGSFGKGGGKDGGKARPGDWKCEECGNLNFSNRSDCKACAAPIGNAVRMGMKSGDWICPNCGDLVFASKSECKMCGNPRSDPRVQPY